MSSISRENTHQQIKEDVTYLLEELWDYEPDEPFCKSSPGNIINESTEFSTSVEKNY